MCNRTQFPQNHRERETQKDFTSLPLCPGSASVMRVCQEGRMELSKEARLWKGTGLDFSCPMFSMAITFLCVLCFCRMTLWVGGGGRGAVSQNIASFTWNTQQVFQEFPTISSIMAETTEKELRKKQKNSLLRCSIIKTELSSGAE